MRIDCHLQHDNRIEGVLSDHHAASSYGQPVLVIDGQAYGPGDGVRGWLPYLEVVPDNCPAHEQAEGIFDALLCVDCQSIHEATYAARDRWNAAVAQAWPLDKALRYDKEWQAAKA